MFIILKFISCNREELWNNASILAPCYRLWASGSYTSPTSSILLHVTDCQTHFEALPACLLALHTFSSYSWWCRAPFWGECHPCHYSSHRTGNKRMCLCDCNWMSLHCPHLTCNVANIPQAGAAWPLISLLSNSPNLSSLWNLYSGKVSLNTEESVSQSRFVLWPVTRITCSLHAAWRGCQAANGEPEHPKRS